MAAISTCYISAGCNRTPNVADWGRNSLLCFGTCRSVAICVPEGTSRNEVCTIQATLMGHKDKVNCVRWIRHADHAPETELVSGSVDKTAICWKLKDGEYKISNILIGHDGPVTAVDALCLPLLNGESAYGRQLIVTTSADSSVRIWNKVEGKDMENTQTLTYGRGFILSVSLVQVPHTDLVLLACAGDDMKVHLYIEQVTASGRQFTSVMTLPGHEDWVRTVDLTVDDSGDILLASAGQDHIIRMWRLSPRETDTGVREGFIRDLPLSQDIRMKEDTFKFRYRGKEVVYAVSLESVLSGHENWIYSVRWQSSIKTETGYHQPIFLLSASMDKTMILWKPEKDSGVWIEAVRVGEVGGNTLGLYGGMFGPDGLSILAHGYQGAFHHWKYNPTSNLWEAMVTVSGHFDIVQDLDWDRGGGQFLLTSSSDQTTRLHAPWVKSDRQFAWYELARPQVHGYDMQCCTMINRYQFASGAEEKVVRVFDAPQNFIENFCTICGIDLENELAKEEAANRPEGASVPALGLSNKAIFSGETQDMTQDLEIKPGENEQYTDIYFRAVSLKEPPSEEHLLQNTLWPEVQKLYGHGYEIFALACDPGGKILASACKAVKAEYAGIILWDTLSWQQLCTLHGHTLTVTQIAFSHNGEYLLSVSRDRTWCLFKRRQPDQPESDSIFFKVANVDKKTAIHSRIIWSCAWSHDDKHFVTASRDKKVIMWSCPKGNGDKVHSDHCPAGTLDVSASATAVDMAPDKMLDESYLVSIGLETGSILIYKWSPGEKWRSVGVIDKCAHHLSVKRLKFRPCFGLAGIHGDDIKVKDNSIDRKNWLQLASCGEDQSVRIFNINLTQL
ncbi:hypothetical protein CHS0354_019687 [Potamilus streckersoni]|uniref:Elongator complex protein 2 n=2 Tax=Potamilus streckersoni TaxID=2493646 RepID=A0AAE0VSS2_9BIVA|nr:hypothetical protein CHS0354_019687 [Potamilus streckersoni]